MKIQYNIYRMEKKCIPDFLEKINKSGLVRQGIIRRKDYNLAFFFSENNPGIDVKWWGTYKAFINQNTQTPKNIFHYGLLIALPRKWKRYAYIASLGKSHFYLNKFIDNNFGISFAVNLTKGRSILLKKSRFFTGIKKAL